LQKEKQTIMKAFRSNQLLVTIAKKLISYLLLLVLSGTMLFAPGSRNEAQTSFGGCLDNSFDGDGRVISEFRNPFGSDSRAVAVRASANGKLIAAGSTSKPDDDVVVARYNNDGSFDTTFGIDGFVTVDVVNNNDDTVSDMELQADGKIVVVGFLAAARDFFLVRLNADGTLDASFDGDGKVVTLQDQSAVCNKLATQQDGKLVVVGRDGTGRDGIVLRYNTDGSLDATFGNAGTVTADLGSPTDSFNDVAIQADGRIVVGGTTRVAGRDQFAAARFNTDGTLDATFGTGGIVITDLSGDFDRANAIEIQSDGRILLGGETDRDSTNAFDTAAAIVRYNTNGSLDASFGKGGIVEADFFDGFDRINDLVIQTDGRIVAAGSTRETSTNNSDDFLAARFNANGGVDVTFGTGGKVATDFGNGLDDGRSVALQQDGRIVVAGSEVGGFISNGQGFGLVRYLSEGCAASDISVALSAPTTVIAGQNIVYDILITNSGSSPQSVSLVMQTPDNTEFVSFVNPSGTVDVDAPSVGGTGTILCDIEDIPAATTVTGQLTVNVRSNTPDQIAIILRADVIPEGSDPESANNVATAQTIVDAIVTNLALNLSASPSAVTIGQNVTYTINVTNLGPETAPSVVVTDDLPAEVQLVSISANGGVISAVGDFRRTITFASLAANASATVTIVAEVDCSVADNTTITNDASVSAASFDPDASNNFASIDIIASNAAPLITCPANTVVNSVNQPNSSVIVNYANPVVTDNCGAKVECNPPSGSVFPQGTTTVTCTASDIQGATANCSFTVTVNVFDLCIQDDVNHKLLRFNSANGNYQFFDCLKGESLGGRGVITRNGCKVELRDSGPDPKHPDRNVYVLANVCTKAGNATVQLFSPAKTHTLSDGNITNNACACQ
jgi:uncharacterized delta-60 repeat protein/uncharacterized repeat protein (TIGR01451 family)